MTACSLIADECSCESAQSEHAIIPRLRIAGLMPTLDTRTLWVRTLLFRIAVRCLNVTRKLPAVPFREFRPSGFDPHKNLSPPKLPRLRPKLIRTNEK